MAFSTHYLFTLLIFCTIQFEAFSQPVLQTPDDFLGYELGTRFTRHSRVVDYFEHVAAASGQVVLEQYGETYEGRPLITAYIASPENMARLEEIRLNNLRLAGMEDGSAEDASPAIVWLGYNVHGNESVSMEASMKTLHALVDPNISEAQNWLENTVVVMDPCLNPDGRDRYANWYNRMVGRFPNASPEAREHQEPWPGGRTNHYYFDLNRDWAWMSQQELQARVLHYNKWMPHVHVDFHEQGVDQPYFFAPAAEPYHEAVTPWQREFQMMIGKNHTRYFDSESWLYFTRQVFDLLYPGYGDTWPTFNGAIGMTYEQGGSGRAGLGIVTAEGDTLTLNDRIAHHFTTGMSTIEIASQNKDRVVEEFTRFFGRARNEPTGDYESYVIKGLTGSDKRKVLEDYFDAQGIRYGYADSDRNAQGYQYSNGTTARFQIESGDMVLNARQPKSTLLRVLFDPQPELSDSLTYDVTSWALPYVYGLDAYAVDAIIDADESRIQEARITITELEKPYAYLAPWKSFEDARFLAALLRKGVKSRYAEKAFQVGGKSYDAGTIILTRTGNERLGDRFDTIIRETAEAMQQSIEGVSTGFVDRGSDFGSADVRFIKTPRIAALIGESMSPYRSGEVWHFFDRQLGYPITLLHANRFDPSDLAEYDVLVLPTGSYGSVLTTNKQNALRQWIRDGGRLVALESAAAFLAGKEGFDLEPKKKKSKPDSLEQTQRRYEDRRRESISDDVPGAIYRVEMDNSHPLAFGYPEIYYTLKGNDDIYAYLKDDDDWNVGVLPESGHLSGFVGFKAKAELKNGLVIGVQRMGRGDVVYIADTPLFRGFWYNGRLLMANAVFLR